MSKVRVWDLPTRVFHWGLVLCFMALLATGEFAGSAMAWHFWLGYTVLSLVLFRLVWGVVGGHWSRFRTFVVSPSTVLRYLRGMHTPLQSAGHNPLGALSVLALLVLVLVQATAGLFSDDEIATAGPLSKMASSGWVGLATAYHTQAGKVLLILLVLLHVAALLFYRIKKGDDLLPAMVHGDKELPAQFEASRDDGVSRLLSVVIFGFCAGAVAYLVRWAALV